MAAQQDQQLSLDLTRPPRWLPLAPEAYGRMVNRLGVVITKRARKRGADFQVHEAMEAIHAACHASGGIDPYDGQALRPVPVLLLGRKDAEVATGALLWRSPTLIHRTPLQDCDFEVVSWQTAQARAVIPAEDFIAHCRAVAAWVQTEASGVADP